jgi:hypothetical protein
MIEAATERRLAGDWLGACAAANVDVTFDFNDVADRNGAKMAGELAGELAADLAGLAPDLLRWHLPRMPDDQDVLRPDLAIVLARYRNKTLFVRTPPSTVAAQRLTLAFGAEPGKHTWDWAGDRYLWDAGQADELRVHCDGGERTPFFQPDGTLAELPVADPGDRDPAGGAEWLAMLQDRGQVVEAFALAGIRLDHTTPEQPRWYRADPMSELAAQRLMLTRLVAEAQLRRKFRVPINSYWWLLVEAGRRGDLAARVVGPEDFKQVPELGMTPVFQLPDIELVRCGHLTPDQLHPLVRRSLFPARPEPTEPAEELLPPVRVRCQGGWHQVANRDGVLSGPHTEQERRREQALKALGGKMSGCFQARQSWADGSWLPKRLRAQRNEVFARLQHGDTAGVVALLDAGLDPHVKDGRKRTLLHQLHLVEHELLLPRLLDIGIDLHAADHDGRTALQVAVWERGSPELILELVAAGARLDVVDIRPATLSQLVKYSRRTDLDFLLEEINRLHPELAKENT